MAPARPTWKSFYEQTFAPVIKAIQAKDSNAFDKAYSTAISDCNGCTAALALTGEYSNMCTMGLALGKDVQTDCSINGLIGGKTYCFGSEDAKTEFMKDPQGNLAKAQAYYSKKHPG